MLDAAIKVAKDDAARQISEKDKTIRTLKKDHKDAQEHWAAEQTKSEEDRKQESAQIAARLAALEDQQRRDRATLSDFQSRQEQLLGRGVRRANLVVTGTQLVLGLILAVLGVVASFGAVMDTPPCWADYTLKTFTVVGLVLTVQALRGRGVPGLSHVSEALGRRLFLRYVRDKGVPEQPAIDRLSLEHGRLRLRDEREVLALDEPPRVCRRLQPLSRMEHHEQDHEQVFP